MEKLVLGNDCLLLLTKAGAVWLVDHICGYDTHDLVPDKSALTSNSVLRIVPRTNLAVDTAVSSVEQHSLRNVTIAPKVIDKQYCR